MGELHGVEKRLKQTKLETFFSSGAVASSPFQRYKKKNTSKKKFWLSFQDSKDNIRMSRNAKLQMIGDIFSTIVVAPAPSQAQL